MENFDPIAFGKTIFMALLVAAAYGLPSLVAACRRHRRSERIAVLNLLLGWTIVGWLILLVWALRMKGRWFHVRRRAVRAAERPLAAGRGRAG
jgi:hypothetical protein